MVELHNNCLEIERGTTTDVPEWLHHLSILRLEPGDALVVKVNEPLSMQLMDRVRSAIEQDVKRVLGTDIRVLLVDSRMDIGVVRAG
jgi:hypothetical protein